MKYTVEQKAQLMAIQNPEWTYAGDLGKYVIITEGHIGYYIPKNNLIIDISKLRPIGDKTEQFIPEVAISKTVPAKKTKTLHQITDRKIAIKLISDDGKKAWVNINYLKQFGDGVSLRISGEKDAIYVSYSNGLPAGIIMPMNVSEE